MYTGKLCLVDTSWLMWSSYHAESSLSCLLQKEDGSSEVVPTGHIYGILRQIPALSSLFETVLLVQDSPCLWRKEIFPGYKEGRVKEGDFNPYQHLEEILSAATSFHNVYTVKVEGEEADDIIASFIYSDYDPWVFSKDNDLMQLRKPFHMFNSIVSHNVVELDVKEYIKGKYGLDLPFLPVWWKTIRGDSSDNISPGAKRMYAKEIVPLCMDLKEETSFDIFYERFEQTSYAVTHQDCRESLYRNYQLVSPHIIDLEALVYKKTPDISSGISVLKKYGILSLFRPYQELLNV